MEELPGFDKMLLSIIIINYKTFDLTKKSIESLEALLDRALGENAQLIVVDNGSDKGDVIKLQKLRDKLGFKLVLSDINLGFAAGCNFGAQIAQGENLLFLNSDTKVVSGIMDMAYQLNREDELGILGGKILGEDGKIEKSAGKFYNLWQLFLMLIGGQRFGADRFSPKSFERVDWVSGGFMMVKRQVFEDLSGFDEDFFMYLEDMDLCLRASKKGLKTYYFPSSEIIHNQHGSSSRKFAITNIYKSLIIFYKKNKSKIQYNIAISMLFTKAILAYSAGLVLGKRDLKETYSDILQLF